MYECTYVRTYVCTHAFVYTATLSFALAFAVAFSHHSDFSLSLSLRRFSQRMATPAVASVEQDAKLLGVSPQAPVEVIKSAYRRLAKQMHPDTCTNPEVCVLLAYMKMYMCARECVALLLLVRRARANAHTVALLACNENSEGRRQEVGLDKLGAE